MGKQITPRVKKTEIPSVDTKAKTMNFPDAIREVINGKKIARLSWRDTKDYGFMKNGWLTIFTRGEFHTWSINDGDLEAQDWAVKIVVDRTNGQN